MMWAMIVAEHISGTTGPARMQSPRDGWRCPVCREPVILRAGRLVIPHFAHRPGSACTHMAGESEEHRRCKVEIADALRAALHTSADVQLERVCATFRPDVSFTLGGRDVAVEVQRSALSLDEIDRRTTAYYEHGVHVLWLSPRFPPTAGERYAARAWERWAHGLYFGRMWYYAGEGLVASVRYEPHVLWAIDVPPPGPVRLVLGSKWRVHSVPVSGEPPRRYEKRSKRWVEPTAPETLCAVHELSARKRDAWRNLPAALLWT
jgi:hypothetical protein